MNTNLSMKTWLFVTIILLSTFGFLINSVSASNEVTHTVNTQIDGADFNMGDGICDMDAGTNGAQCSLRAAIQEANATTDHDLITLPSGLYELTEIGPDEDNAATGDLDVTAPLTLQGSGAETTIIDGNGNIANNFDRVFDLYADVTITGVTIQHGKASYGGGMTSVGEVTISGSIVKENYALGDTGGIFNGGTMTLINSTVISNTADLNVGGIYNVHQLSLINSNIESNIAQDEAGGIYNLFITSIITVTQSTIQNNTASAGAGLYNNGGLVTISDSTINHNQASELHGGGLYNKGTFYLTNSTISGNRATNFGGGIFNEPGGTVDLSNVTVAFNKADSDDDNIGDGGGVYNNNGTFQLRNSIISDNTLENFIFDTADDCGGTLTSFSYNWVFSLNTCALTAGNGDVSGLDPKLGPLQANGGVTLTHALLPDSPAIDAGPATYCRDHLSTILNKDQRGTDRHLDGNGNGTAYCDPGAFEYQMTFPIYLPVVTR